MTIDKIKHDSKTGKTTVEWHEGPADDPDGAFTLTGKDAPAPAFLDALASLGRDVEQLCEVNLDADHLTVRGVTLGETDDGVCGCITAIYRVQAGVLVLNSPYGPVGDLCALRLAGLRREAEAYVHGVRAQGSLFADQEPTGSETVTISRTDPETGEVLETTGPMPADAMRKATRRISKLAHA